MKNHRKTKESRTGTDAGPQYRNNTSRGYLFWKRLMDIVVSCVGLIVFSPICLYLIIMIKKEDRGNIFYKQGRLTQNGKLFYIYKFRSMKIGAEPTEQEWLAEEDDNRCTKIGRLMRKKHWDEIPQFINVLRSEMSIIGGVPSVFACSGDAAVRAGL